MTRRSIAASALAVVLSLSACAGPGTGAGSPGTPEAPSRAGSVNPSAVGNVRAVSYEVSYRGRQYAKTANVYVPASYREGTPMDVLYLMHGSGMDHDDLASTMRPQFDQWIADGDMAPMLVVIPTYYPDDSFVVADYSQDYPLNHFFATDEIAALMPVVEGTFTTHAKDATPEGLRESRRHRAFGGYSMGAITTWDVLAERPEYFAWYVPMAGDSWIGRTTGNSDTAAVADALASGLRENGYSANDFQVIAMVGEADGTKNAMQPQITQLRQAHGDLFTGQSLIYWENEGGGHDRQSFEIETRHAMAYLFAR